MNTAKKIFLCCRFLGMIWLIHRIWYAIKKRSGYLKIIMPQKRWQENFPIYECLLALPKVTVDDFFSFKTIENDIIDMANDILLGKFQFFYTHKISCDFPPHWHKNYLGQEVFPEVHWSQIQDFSSTDIKLIWELGRFSFAYVLARAYVRTYDNRYAEAFWVLLENWYWHNSPNVGVHWKCGQEISVRVMACCFAFHVFRETHATTRERIAIFSQMMHASAQRIAANIRYALQQKNNHGISEAVGLWTIGTLFPSMPKAKRWQKMGHRILVTAANTLIDEDGGFSQHSTNYHRVLLHNYVWVFALAKQLQYVLPKKLTQKVYRAYQLLYQLYDPVSGRVPNYGANDGACILPLNQCDYLDYRPVLQALHYYFSGTRCFPAGIWDEDILWLFGRTSLAAPIAAPILQNLSASVGGYFTLRGEKSWAFVRAAHYRYRPSQADQLHVDIWWQGKNMALDAGTYSYYLSTRSQLNFSRSKIHNTVTVDHQDHMQQVSRFIWLPWSRATVTHEMLHENCCFWQGKHQIYHPITSSSVTHKRGIVQLGKEHWIILDSLVSQSSHHYRLHYLLADLPFTWQTPGQLILMMEKIPYTVWIGSSLPTSYHLIRASENDCYGWLSTHYYQLSPAISFYADVTANQVLFWTVFGPDVMQVHQDTENLSIITQKGSASLQIAQDKTVLLQKITVTDNF